MAGSIKAVDNPSAFHRFAERAVFGNRAVVLVLFALITIAMGWFGAQLRVDAGFKKQIPLKHEYMQTFLDYEKEFGGANRILIAVMAKNGDMFSQPFMQTMEKITQDVKTIENVDEARIRSIFTPNVRFVEVVEDGFAGGNVIPQEFTPNVEGFEATSEQFATIKANIEKANIVGRLVAKDFSGAMVWAELVPEGGESQVKLDYQKVASQLEGIRAKYENDATSVHIIGFAKMVGDISDGARSVIIFFFLTIAFTWILLFLYSSSVKLATLTVFCALIAVLWMLGALKLLGFGIDPMNMLTPFLIFAIAVSHGEQMINRFRGEIFFGGLEEGTVEELSQRRGVDAQTAARTRVPHAAGAGLGRADGRLHRLCDHPHHSDPDHLRAGDHGHGRRRDHDPDRSGPAAGAAVLLPIAQSGKEAPVPPASADPVRQDLVVPGEIQPSRARRDHHRDRRHRLVLRQAVRPPGDDRRRGEGRGRAAARSALQPGRRADQREVRARRRHAQRHRRSTARRPARPAIRSWKPWTASPGTCAMSKVSSRS